MDLVDLLSQDAILPTLRVSSKKQALQELADKAARLTDAPQRLIFDTLIQREKLGSTGVGNGIAIPHGKLAEIDKLVGIFARLAKPVEFDAQDDQPVDLMFVLLAPEGAGADHLKALSLIARVLRDADTTEKLRATVDKDALYALITQPIEATNAA